MATASDEGASVGRLETRAEFSMVTQRSTCSRCSGLMVSDFCMDLLNSTGELEFAAKRCVQCGEVVDAVIQRNRQFRQESMAVRYSERTVSNNRAVEGP